MVKRIAAKALQVVAGIGAVLFVLMPIRTVTQVLLCFGFLVVALVCGIIAGHLDDKNTGYWPHKPNH